MGWGRQPKNPLRKVPEDAEVSIRFSAKCSDMFSGTLKVGDETFDLQDGVPNLGLGGGDYVEMEIDLRTGKIINWTPPSEKKLKIAVNGEEWVEEEEDDEQT